METKLPTIDFTSTPFWVLIVLLTLFVIAFSIFLYLGISGKRDVKFWFLEIKNSGLNISAEKKVEPTKFSGSWEVKAKDIEIPNYPFTVKYCYQADLNIEVKKFEIELSGHLTYRDYLDNEKIYDTKIEGYGYIIDGRGSISYKTFNELNKERITTGLGVLYVNFNLNNKSATGYFLTSNQSDYGIGIGIVEMQKKV